MLRELAFAVMRWMEVGEAEVRMVEEMYKETTAVVRAERETLPCQIIMQKFSFRNF